MYLDRLYEWADRFDLDFGLWLRRMKHPAKGKTGSVLSDCRTVLQVRIEIDVLPENRLGEFHFGRELVVLNERHMNRPDWEILGTLAHELLHCWEDRWAIRVRRGIEHSASFIERARRHGLIVDRVGRTSYPHGTQFFQLLRIHGIWVP